MAVRLARIATLVLAIACDHAQSGVVHGQTASDTTASVWLTRAQVHPEIASWLYLRAASATQDSAARASLYARVTLPVARQRVPWIEAAAREHFADTAGAIAAYRALPAPVTVFRLRAGTGAAGRDSVRAELIAFVTSSTSRDAIREGTALFDRIYPDPTPVEQLAVARASSRAGSWSRARTGFQANEKAVLSDTDRFSFATALARTSDAKGAASMYFSIDSPSSLAFAARYQAARALLSAGDASGARAALDSLAAAASDTSAAAALALIADLKTDSGDDSGSRKTLQTLVHRFPSTRFAAPARFNAALIALILGEKTTAEREFGALAKTKAADAIGAEYWLGRAMQSAGHSDGARTAWREVLRRDSTSYYAALAAARLGIQSMHSTPVSAGYPHVASVDSALLRVSLLRDLGMDVEAQFENEQLYRDAPRDTSTLLATAAAFSATDQAARAIALGRDALTRVGSTPDVWRLIYPVAARDTIVAESRREGTDPALVAGLIRQESSFNPRATSPVGARGLMQVMPSVGQSIAAAAGITAWSPAMLYDPGINIEIGIRHLAPLLKSQPDIARSLAAYNAGGSRVARWATKRGAEDPEMFTERIPFLETREYVKSVLRNREFYRVLYTW